MIGDSYNVPYSTFFRQRNYYGSSTFFCLLYLLEYIIEVFTKLHCGIMYCFQFCQRASRQVWRNSIRISATQPGNYCLRNMSTILLTIKRIYGSGNS